MANDLFSKIISIGFGLHKDNRTSNKYQQEFQKLNYKINFSKPPSYKVDIKRPIDIKEKYYFKSIDIKCQEIYNELIEAFHPDAMHPELHYTYTVFFNRLEQYLIDINNYITSRSLGKIDSEIINYLKANAILLFMELQKKFNKYSSKEIIEIEDIYSHYFNTTHPVNSEIIPTEKIIATIIPKKERKAAIPKTAFKYKYNNTEPLLATLKALQLRIDLIDETHSSINQFYELLISNDFTKIDYEIHILCETTQFSYFVTKLIQHFTNFNPTTIERSNKFFTKTGALLKASNLYKNKVHNTKAKEDIDNIIKQLQ